jgi:hypothetical protein
MAEYNATCEPPWSENELRHKLESAANSKRHKWPRGHLAEEKAPTHIHHPSQSRMPEQAPASTLASAPQYTDSADRLLAFLRSFRPQYKTASPESIYFEGVAGCVAVSALHSLAGAENAVKETEAYCNQLSEKGKIKPLTLISLTKELCRIAAGRLLPVLRSRCLEDDPNAPASVRQGLVALIQRPRSSAATTGLQQSWATWCRSLRGSSWVRFGSHPVYGHPAVDTMVARLAMSPWFLHGELAILRGNFASPSQSGRFFLKHGLIARESTPIRCEDYLDRVWEIAPGVLRDACGDAAAKEGELS